MDAGAGSINCGDKEIMYKKNKILAMVGELLFTKGFYIEL